MDINRQDFFEEDDLQDVDSLSEEHKAPELFEHFRFEVDKGQSLLRIDKYLANTMQHTSRNRIQIAADSGLIFVNDKPVKSNYKVKPLDVISVRLTYAPHEFEIIPQKIPLDIIYEDDDLMVINKQPGLVVHPGFGNFEGTLLNGIAYHLKNDSDFDVNNPRLGLVHRIDKNTSGLLVIAKNEHAKTSLGKQFFNKTTYRRYYALVWGNLEQDEGTVVGNIGRHLKDRMLFDVFPPESDQGKPAVTHYKVLERFGYVTLVECRLETGRTHQIRVHMKHIGHILFNDERYGGNIILRGTTFSKYKQFINNCFLICPRQALHAKSLGFIHPRTGKEMIFNSDLPEDMDTLIEKWRNYVSHRENDLYEK